MEFAGYSGIIIAIGLFILLTVAMQLAAEGVFLFTGTVVVKLLTLGKLAIDERRDFIDRSTKLDGNLFGYRENGTSYLYSNFATLIGLVVWLGCLISLGLMKWE